MLILKTKQRTGGDCMLFHKKDRFALRYGDMEGLYRQYPSHAGSPHLQKPLLFFYR